ncbi:MAG TPA: 2-amino-4-hydroxy-6-hydroxymethyldihydropteridine diphosphokinase [Peptococcaceae bacterium]|nr:2-amino-4-hydroxy-6-hydroxymethyldihydropteridine diphosphokinase [Peptococcaceae bacterium]HPZ71393.1 2-amino-4-hydroxy-6-hydroxymethyldihydropteridine diphosphokinase [Peptococcaceae bacterium]HQD54616.1 2-amino-4-hydroxy-6-hydroxymethyldihydropteridine diphosphokinase [Peptococcaceae bacterium]
MSTKAEKVYFSLGSNQGKPLENLLTAIGLLRERVLEELLAVSGIYQTEPISQVPQADFLNLVLMGTTKLSPEETLEECLQIEQEMGRVRTVRWGPRTIDIDLLLFGAREINTKKLQIPHPRMKERAFVLVPLREIASECFARLQAAVPEQKVSLLFSAADVKIMLDKRYSGGES